MKQLITTEDLLNKNKVYLILLMILCVGYSKINAQILLPSESNTNNINFNTGLDNNLLALNIGYSYFLTNLKSSPFISFTQGSSLLATGNFRAELGVNTWQGSFRKFTLKSQLSLVFARSENEAGNYNGLGINFTINPGFKFGNYGFGLDLQYNPFYATYIKHSNTYLQNYYANAKDGWYENTANNKRIGFYAARQFGKENSSEINFKAGYQNNGLYDKLIPNYYGIIGINKSF